MSLHGYERIRKGLRVNDGKGLLQLYVTQGIVRDRLVE